MNQYIRNQSLGIIFSELPSDYYDYYNGEDNQWDIFQEYCQITDSIVFELENFTICKEYENYTPKELYNFALSLTYMQEDSIEEFQQNHMPTISEFLSNKDSNEVAYTIAFNMDNDWVDNFQSDLNFYKK